MVSRLRGGSRLVDVAEDEATEQTEQGGLVGGESEGRWNVDNGDSHSAANFGCRQEKYGGLAATAVQKSKLPPGVLIARARKLNMVEARLRMTQDELQHLVLNESVFAGPGSEHEGTTGSMIITQDRAALDGGISLSEHSEESVVDALESLPSVLAATRTRPKSAAALLRRHHSAEGRVSAAARKRIAKKSDIGKERGVELKDQFQKVGLG